MRENTILSFLKAATNHSDFIEFDVHVTGDGEVVVHHDFDVKLSVGKETVKLGISQVTSKQLQRCRPSPATPPTPSVIPRCCGLHAEAPSQDLRQAFR